MGGKVAMRLALHAPHRVAGLAVVDMAPVAYGHRFDQAFEAFAAVDLAKLQSRADADAAMARVLSEAGVRAFLLQNLYRDADGWRWRCNLAALQAGQALITGFEVDRKVRYAGPASFIHGTASDYLLPQHEPVVRQLFPRARFCAVEDAGHWVYAERPAAFMDCLQQFLRAAR
jgi:pimeloyl-ACP methyl ester carboxylesterase